MRTFNEKRWEMCRSEVFTWIKYKVMLKSKYQNIYQLFEDNWYKTTLLKHTYPYVRLTIFKDEFQWNIRHSKAYNNWEKDFYDYCLSFIKSQCLKSLEIPIHTVGI